MRVIQGHFQNLAILAKFHRFCVFSRHPISFLSSVTNKSESVTDVRTFGGIASTHSLSFRKSGSMCTVGHRPYETDDVNQETNRQQ
jgi:hypothetical protein